jgi:hypothetical protein
MPMSSEDLNVRTLDGGDVELDLSLLVTIPDESRICPGDPDFDGATLICNELVDKEPELVIRPEDSDEVVKRNPELAG